MYLVGVEVTVTWELLPISPAPLSSDFDLVLYRPNKKSVYLPQAIPPANYTAPTEETNGEALVKITPDIPGMWILELVTGTPDNYQILGSVEMFVFGLEVSTPINRVRLPSPPPIEWLLTGWNDVVGEHTFWEYDQALDIWTATSQTISEGSYIPINGWNIGFRRSSILVEVNVAGSSIPNDLTELTITDANDFIIGTLEVLPNIPLFGFNTSATLSLDFSGKGDIEHLIVEGIKNYDHVFEDNLEGFYLTSKPYPVIDSEEYTALPSVSSVENRRVIERTDSDESYSSLVAVSRINVRSLTKYENIEDNYESLVSVSAIRVNQIVKRYNTAPESYEAAVAVSGIRVNDIVIRQDAEQESFESAVSVSAIRVTTI